MKEDFPAVKFPKTNVVRLKNKHRGPKGNGPKGGGVSHSFGGVLTRAPLRELTALLRRSSWFKGLRGPTSKVEFRGWSGEKE